MKRRMRILAGILAGCMLLGQTVFAEEIVPEENEKTEEAAPKTDIGNDSISANEEKTSGVLTTADEQPEEINVTMYAGIPYHMEQQLEDAPYYFITESHDLSICEVSEAVMTRLSGLDGACFNLTPLKAGNVDVTLWSVSEFQEDGTEIRVKEIVYHIEIKDTPDDAVLFKDPVLVKRLIDDNRCDTNDDGYISKRELGTMINLYLSCSAWVSGIEGESITDLTGLEYAVNAWDISLEGNKGLVDIAPLANLDHLKYLYLEDTGVSEEMKWNFAVQDRLEREKGDVIIIPYDLLGEDYSAVKMEIVENNNVISEIQGGEEEYPYFSAVNPGMAKIRVSWKEYSKEMMVTVTGIEANQTLDVEYGMPVQFSQMRDDQDYAFALKENGELWQLYPDMEVIGQNIRIFDYPYVLKEDGKLYDIADMDTVVMENIKQISGNIVLKEDGTVWEEYNTYDEETKTETSDPWVQIADNGKQLAYREGGYGGIVCLKNNGELIELPEGNVIKENVEYIIDEGYYVTGKGFYTFQLDTFLGDIRAKDIAFGYEEVIDGEREVYDLIVTKENEVWAALLGDEYGEDGEYIEYIKELVKLGSNFAAYCGSGNLHVYTGDYQWTWADADGNYYKYDKLLEPSEENQLLVECGDGYYAGSEYQLTKRGDDRDNHLYKNNAEMLDSVRHIEEVDDIYTGETTVFALRNDGSIWNVTNTPEKIGTINTGDDIVKGDVTGDSEVEIDDLRLVLRAVCRKVTLTDTQKLAADVEKNGEVNIADLRLMLRFVCGKVESL